MLNILKNLPKNFLDLPHERFHEIFKGPSLIHLPGRRMRPLFVSVLLHGNEPSGLLAVQKLLRKNFGNELPRALSLFIGNIEGAKFNKRFVNGQPDYNRIWQTGNLPENEMALEVVKDMQNRDVFACVDLHNTTGLNPHHACVHRLSNEFLHLATLFSRTVIYLTKPEGTLAGAFADTCPSVTVECGKPGHDFGTEHAEEFLDSCLHIDHFPDTPVKERDMELFHTVAIIKIPGEAGFGFGDCDEDIRFREDLEELNFNELPVGATLAKLGPGISLNLKAWDEAGREIGGRYFAADNGAIRTVKRVMPSLLTTDAEAIKKDCLCYLMERMKMNKMGSSPK